jgi:hypothetical protein
MNPVRARRHRLRLCGLLLFLCALPGCRSSSGDNTAIVDDGGTPADGAGEADAFRAARASADGSSTDGAPARDASMLDGNAEEGVAVDAPAGDGNTTMQVFVTFYGWADNSPPGNAIAYPMSAGNPTLHNGAGGVGTYSDPITFATAPAEFPPGTRLYVPFIEKYVMMEDSCGQCTTDWTNSRKWHIDVWMNSSAGENANSLTSCEDSWTRSQTDVEFSPPPTRPVTTAPLFDPSTNTCRTTP